MSESKRDRQAAKLGSLIDASYKLAERIRIASGDFDFSVADKVREAAMNTRGTIVMLEEARDMFAGRRVERFGRRHVQSIFIRRG
jgi:hypothetical protein